MHITPKSGFRVIEALAGFQTCHTVFFSGGVLRFSIPPHFRKRECGGGNYSQFVRLELQKFLSLQSLHNSEKLWFI
jgi:hypothetical protein